MQHHSECARARLLHTKSILAPAADGKETNYRWAEYVRGKVILKRNGINSCSHIYMAIIAGCRAKVVPEAVESAKAIKSCVVSRPLSGVYDIFKRVILIIITTSQTHTNTHTSPTEFSHHNRSHFGVLLVFF